MARGFGGGLWVGWRLVMGRCGCGGDLVGGAKWGVKGGKAGENSQVIHKGSIGEMGNCV